MPFSKISDPNSSGLAEAITIVKCLACPGLLLNGEGQAVYANDNFLLEFSCQDSLQKAEHLDDILKCLEKKGLTVKQPGVETSMPKDSDNEVYIFRCLPVPSADNGTICMFLKEEIFYEDSLSIPDMRDFLEHANDLIQSVGPDGRFLYVNNAWKKTLGYSDRDIQNMTFQDILADSCTSHCAISFQRVLAGERLEHVEVAFKAKDGSIIHAEGSCNCRFHNGKPVSTRGIFRDVTARKKAEEERARLKKRLEKAQLFESLGLMAGGIAHDYNNILMIIMGFSELLLASGHNSPKVTEYAEKIHQSASKAEALTRQMLNFAGAGQAYLEKRDLSTLVAEMEEELHQAVSPERKLFLELEQGLPSVEIDASQYKQAVMNLVTNAAEATEPGSGTITVRTGVIEAGMNFFQDAVLDDSLPGGTYCFTEVEDNGSGMPPEVKEKAFEPFFSTRFHGRGLGLASTLGMVRGHRGAIKLKSAPGKGTTVSIFFPAIRDESTENKTAP